MKRVIFAALFGVAFSLICFGQDTLNIPSNAILKNFRPFATPRTNYRPGTVFRIDDNKRSYFVEDVKAIKEFTSEEGTLVGRMAFTKGELLTVLNLETEKEYVMLEVEIKEAVREFNEQTGVDRIMWEKDKAESIIVDEGSKYFIIREAILTQEVTYRITEEAYNSMLTGKVNLSQTVARGDETIDFPYYITKKFKEPRRVFYLDQEIGLEPYGE